jgi:hypothetical protein
MHHAKDSREEEGAALQEKQEEPNLMNKSPQRRESNDMLGGNTNGNLSNGGSNGSIS